MGNECARLYFGLRLAAGPNVSRSSLSHVYPVKIVLRFSYMMQNIQRLNELSSFLSFYTFFYYELNVLIASQEHNNGELYESTVVACYDAQYTVLTLCTFVKVNRNIH